MRTSPLFPLSRAAALAAGLALAISTVITAVPAKAVSPTAPPAANSCYDYRSSSSEDETAVAVPVPCEGEHTAQTFYTRSLPEGFGIPDQAGPKKRLKVAKPCTTDAMNAYLGLSDTTIPSRFQIVTVFPTAGQWNAGERWMRCDVVLRGGKEFTRFSGSAPQLFASTPREQFHFCTPSVPGNRTKAAYPCIKPKKSWIMVAEQDLGAIGKKFRGHGPSNQGERICQRVGNRYTERKKFYPWWAVGDGCGLERRRSDCAVLRSVRAVRQDDYRLSR